MDKNKKDNSVLPMPSMEYPARYRISVRGYLDDRWSHLFAEMTITTNVDENAMVTTVIEGRLADQSALTGVINILNDLHLPLLAVECIDSEDN